MDFDAYERRLWAGRAAAYERGFARLTAQTAGALLDAAGVAAGTRLLDIGTGSGVVARAAAARGAQVTAVDAEPSMAEAAARNVPGLDVRVAVLPAGYRALRRRDGPARLPADPGPRGRLASLDLMMAASALAAGLLAAWSRRRGLRGHGTLIETSLSRHRG